MRKVVSGTTLAAAVAATFLVAAPAAAGEPVHIEAATPIADPATDFTSTLEGCESGSVENGPASVAFTPRFGIFNGFKVFSCGDTDGGFVVRLQAKFSDAGSTGTWAIVRSWGSQEGLHGAGTLVGVPLPPDGILDIYDGTLRP